MRRTASNRSKENAKKLRSRMTGPEKVLWADLRERRNQVFALRRQHTIGPHIVDFVCMSCRVVIEIDGRSHDGEVIIRDKERDTFFESLGFIVLRISNDDVLKNTGAVLSHIWRALEERKPS